MQVRSSHDMSSPDDADKPAPPVLQQALAGLGWGLLT